MAIFSLLQRRYCQKLLYASLQAVFSCILLCVIFAEQQVYAYVYATQTGAVDSLNALLRRPLHDTLKVRILNQLSLLQHTGKPEYARELAREAYTLATKHRFTFGMAESLRMLGNTFQTQSRYDSSLAYYRRALDLAKQAQDKRGTASITSNIGFLYYNRGVYDKALEHYLQSLTLREELGDKSGMAFSFNGIGLVYGVQGDFAQALRHYEKALKLREELGDKRGMSGTLSNMGDVYVILKEYDKAKDVHIRALGFAETLGNKQNMIASLNSLGTIYRTEGQFAKALEQYRRAFEYAGQLKDGRRQANSLAAIGNLFVALGARDSAEATFKAAEKLCVQVDSKTALLDVYKGFQALEEDRGNTPQALEWLKRFMLLRDTVFSTERNTAIAEMQTRFDTEKKERAIQLLEREREFQTLQLRQAQAEALAQEAQAEQRLLAVEQERQRNALLERDKQVQNLQLKENAQAITLLERDKALQRTDLERKEFERRAMIGLFTILLFAALAIAAVFARSNARKKRDNEELVRQQNLLEQQAGTIQVTNTELQERNVQLQTVNKELHYLNNELAEANRFKTQMLSIAAHDLKNPLGAIVGFTELAQAELKNTALPTANTTEAASMLEHVQITAERMRRLITDLLDSAAIELGNITLNLDETSLSMIVHGSVERFFNQAEQKQQIIECPTNEVITCKGDTERLAQVFDNLLSNAVKYSPHGTMITVRFAQTPAIARVEVIDQGPGLSDDDQSKLFGFFQRLSAQPTGDETSNGVGLAIAKKIVDLHNGKIWCESEPGNGATFIVELPKEPH